MLTLILSLALTGAPQAKPATNTKCPVMGSAIKPGKGQKVTVRGQEYLVCCKGCDKKLAATPDKYLEKDGTPKNAKG